MRNIIMVIGLMLLAFPAGVGAQASYQGYQLLSQDIHEQAYALQLTGQIIQAEEAVRHAQIKKLNACVKYIQNNAK